MQLKIQRSPSVAAPIHSTSPTRTADCSLNSSVPSEAIQLFAVSLAPLGACASAAIGLGKHGRISNDRVVRTWRRYIIYLYCISVWTDVTLSLQRSEARQPRDGKTTLMIATSVYASGPAAAIHRHSNHLAGELVPFKYTKPRLQLDD